MQPKLFKVYSCENDAPKQKCNMCKIFICKNPSIQILDV